jgi:sugar/nucleoside kinase (ribokinase family)
VSLAPELTTAPVVVLANMAPGNQLELLEQCTAPNRFVLADTMDLWIDIAREQLERVLMQIDLLVINETEAREYAGTTNLVEAGALLRAKGPKYVVIKLGEFGAILFGPPEINHGLFRCGAFPLREVVDPTGAGDTFLGAMAGYLASLGTTDYSFPTLRDSIVRGTVMASFTCEAFSTRRLEELPEQELLGRMEIFREMSCW